MNALVAEWVAKVVIRYPGTFATKQDASDAVNSAKNVRDFVLPKL